MDELTEKLFKAVASGHYKVAATLVDQGAPVNAADSDGNSPLHLLALRGQSEGLRLLISKGANTNATNKQGRTPLHLAVEWAAHDLEDHLPEDRRPPTPVSILIANGADVFAMDLQGDFPRDTAQKLGNWRMARSLQRKMTECERPLRSLPESELLERQRNAQRVVSVVEAELKRRTRDGLSRSL